MKNTIRKSLSLVLTLILILALGVPLSTNAATMGIIDEITVSIPDQDLEIALTNVGDKAVKTNGSHVHLFVSNDSYITLSRNVEVFQYDTATSTRSSAGFIEGGKTYTRNQYYEAITKLTGDNGFSLDEFSLSTISQYDSFLESLKTNNVSYTIIETTSLAVDGSLSTTTGNTPPSTSTPAAAVTPGTKTVVYSGSDFKIEETIISGNYDQISNFYPNGTAGVSIDGKWGFIDSTGKVLVEPKYTTFWGYSEGDLAAVPNSSGKWGYVNTKTGVVTIPHDYDIAYSFSEGLAAVEKDGKIGFIDASNKFVIDAKYDSSFDFSEGHSSASLNEKYGVIDKNGKTVVPFEYDYLGAMMDGMMVAKLNDKWGYIDITGKVVVDIKYDGCFTFFEGVGRAFFVKNDEIELLYVDKAGKTLHTVSGSLSAVGPFSEGISRITDSDYNVSFIDKSFNEVFSLPAPGAWTDFQEGLATRWARNYISFFDKTGKELSLEHEYWLWAQTDVNDIIPRFNNGILAVRRADGDHPWVILKKTSADTAPVTPPPSTPPSSQTVSPTASTVYVNGVAKAFEAYYIGGNNFFKLRDLAFVLNGTEKQFEVGYDNETKAITLTSGESYTAVSGEMVQGDGKSKTATPTPSRIYLDGKELNFVVYNIGGNNFFKLRDLMEVIDVYVGYDNTAKSITLDTSEGYVAE